MAEVSFLQGLTVVFLVAAVTTLVFYRLRQPVVLGYIVAGLIISPNTPPRGLVPDIATIEAISELGLIFLLFSLGLEWSLGAVRKLGPGILLATPVQVTIMIGAGYGLGRLAGWAHTEAALLGMGLAISSTVIIMKTLGELGQFDAPHGRGALGINAIEDIIAVALISLIPTFVALGVPPIGQAAATFGGLLLFVAVTVIVGYIVVPRLVSHVARLHLSDVLVVTLVGIAFGLSLLAQRLGFAAAFGAFLAGFLIAGSEQLHEVRERIEPLRDVFGGVFFVSIGMLVEPAVVLDAWPMVLGAAALVLVLKPLAVTFSLVLTGRGAYHATRTSLFLLPIGEMAFVIAGTAAAAGLSRSLLSVLTGVALVTALVGPNVAYRADRVARWLSERAPQPLQDFSNQYARWADRLANRSTLDPGYRAAVRRRVWLASLDLLFVVLLFGAAALLERRLPAEIAVGRGGLSTAAVVYGAATLFAVAPLTLAVRNGLEAHGLVARGMTPDRLWTRGEDRDVVGRVLRDTVGSALLVVAAVLLLLGLMPLLPAPPVLVTFAVLLVGALLLFFDAAISLHGRVQRTVEVAFTAGLTPEGGQEVRDMLATQYPWGVVFEEATLPSGSFFAGRPLGEVNMRRDTGATVVSIRREERVIVNPGPDQLLLGGDRLLLAGEPGQVVKARDLLVGASPLERHLDPVGATTLEVVVDRGSALAGKTLRETNLRRLTGAVVLAVVRGGRMASHPSPDERIGPGDRLLLVGTGEQLDKARRLLGRAGPDGGPDAPDASGTA